ncbi:RecB family exonuclease, partial [Nocardia gipuzkoensis]
SLSVSQYKSYERCPYGYYLERIERVWQRPAAWLSQGTAVHKAIEEFELSGRAMTVEQMQAVFRESYVAATNEMCEVTPNLNYWFRSGPYGGAADIGRRYRLGLEQVAGYPRWVHDHPEEQVWVTPDGTLAVELYFEVDLDGVVVRGYIDSVIFDPHTGRKKVRDCKTGRQPGDSFQLGTYRAALEAKFGIEPPAT